ncbi:MAG: hypothetical protein DRJ52_09805 [Thermoprotei archaeon]|nr:MAG: hypothetical protein DRJ52_09805 [Thermoprotei archaeon]
MNLTLILLIFSAILVSPLNYLIKLFYRTVREKISSKISKRSPEEWLNLALKAERFLYIVLSSFYLILFTFGIFLRCAYNTPLDILVILAILLAFFTFSILAIVTYHVENMPVEQNRRYLKLGLLLIHPLILVPCILGIVQALLNSLGAVSFADLIQNVTKSLEIKLPSTLLIDFLAFMFFTGMYSLAKYCEGSREPKKKRREWDIVVMLESIRVIFIMPIVTFAVLLTFDFITTFRPIAPGILSSEVYIGKIPIDSLIAVVSGIITMIAEIIKEKKQESPNTVLGENYRKLLKTSESLKKS